MKIGLSLSFCVKEILDGVVDINTVDVIVSSTRFDNKEQAIESYGQTYWREHFSSTVGEKLALIWPKVVQPRMMGPLFHDYFHYTGKDQFWIEARNWPEVWKQIENRNVSTQQWYERRFSQ